MKTRIQQALGPSDTLTLSSDNVWFTSDMHFGHANILRYCDRPFPNVDQMNASMIHMFMDALNSDSILINLGDVTMNDKYLWALRKVPGTHVLVPGNHDSIWPAHKKFKTAWNHYAEHFNMIMPIHTKIILDGVEFLASHLPYTGDAYGEDKHTRFRPEDKGIPLITGHVHNAWKYEGHQFNVGVDMNDFEPVPASRVLEWSKTL